MCWFESKMASCLHRMLVKSSFLSYPRPQSWGPGSTWTIKSQQTEKDKTTTYLTCPISPMLYSTTSGTSGLMESDTWLARQEAFVNMFRYLGRHSWKKITKEVETCKRRWEWLAPASRWWQPPPPCQHWLSGPAWCYLGEGGKTNSKHDTMDPITHQFRCLQRRRTWLPPWCRKWPRTRQTGTDPWDE